MEFSGPGVNDVGLSIVKSNKLSRKIVWVEFPVEFGDGFSLVLISGTGLGLRQGVGRRGMLKVMLNFQNFSKHIRF